MNNRQAIRALVRKDIRSVTASVQLWLPMLIVPLIIGIIMPSALLWAACRWDSFSGQHQLSARIIGCVNPWWTDSSACFHAYR